MYFLDDCKLHMDPARTVERFISSLLASDRAMAASCLSGNFGLHDGVDSESYLDREIREFQDRRHWFQGDRFQVLVTETQTVQGEYSRLRFSCLDHEGRFIYEDTLFFDLMAQIRGNQRLVECVTKVFFPAGQDPCRQVAIRAPGGIIRHARIPGVVAEIDLNDGANMEEDSFQVLTIRIHGDDLKERHAPVRFLLEDNDTNECTHAQEILLLRGIDHPQFQNMTPRIEGDTVHMPVGKMRVWSLTCFDQDGTATTYEYPDLSCIKHGRKITRAVLTDALDNDWEVTA